MQGAVSALCNYYLRSNIVNRLKFYNIDDKYIEYLYNFDKRVLFNKNGKRPYIGIILEINGRSYVFTQKTT